MNLRVSRQRNAAVSLLLVPSLLVFPAAAFAQLNDTTTVSPEPEDVTVENDTIAPEFLSIAGISVEPTSISVVWTTDELSSGLVEYGRTSAYGQTSPESATVSMEHAQILTGLEAATTYQYRILAIDAAGNRRYSANKTITTAAEPEIADNQAPAMTSISVSHVTATSSRISVTTDEESTARIEYGTSPGSTSHALSSSALSLSHDFSLSSLEPDTVYHFRVVVEDAAGNSFTSPDEILTTPAVTVVEPLPEPEPVPVPEPTPDPVISATSTDEGGTPTSTTDITEPAESVVSSTEETVAPTLAPLAIIEHETSFISTSTVQIFWVTNKPAHGSVSYGTTEAHGQTASVSRDATSHGVLLKGLAPGTNYFYQIVSQTAGGERATVADQEFNTLSVAVPLVESLKLSDAAISDIGETSAVVSWTTNLPASSEVEYGPSTNYVHTSGRDATLKTSHRMTLSSLASGRRYHLRIASQDPAGNAALSENLSFITTAVTAAPAMRSFSSGTSTPPLASVAVNDLRIVDQSPTTLTVAWSAPTVSDHVVDDFTYDLRFSQALITIGNFPGLPAGQDVIFQPERQETDGRTVRFTFIGLRPKTTYHMALRVHGQEGQLSHISNVVSGKTLPARAGRKNPEAPNGPPPAPPQLVKIRAMDSQVMFVWRRSTERAITKTVIVKKDGSYPKSPADGEIVYEGNGKTFTDTNVRNGTLQLYSLFQQGPYGRVSVPLRVRTVPGASVQQIRLPALPAASDPTPAYRFPTELGVGDRGKTVEHLQTVLAEQSELYPSRRITGYFGRLTQAAVKKFQRKNGLAINGRLDEATRQKLERLSRALRVSR